MALHRSFVRRSAVYAALAVLFAAQAHAQPEQRPVYPANAPNVSYKELDKLPDWRGIWQPNLGRVSGGEPQLIGDAKAFYERERAKEQADPTYEIPEQKSSNCEPLGMPGMMTMPYSLEFLFTPGKIVIIQEALMQVRRVFTDGRPTPEYLDPSYFGYSTGHWEGDTLVIETTGLRPGLRLGRRGISSSGDLKITERIYLDENNKDLMHLDFTYEDPNVLAAPWQQQHTFRRDRTWDIIEYVCEQNDRHPIGEDGQTHAEPIRSE